MLRIWCALLLAVCCCAQAAVPERPRFRIVGPAQGLPSTEIMALARDHAGYLWIATADGLARHDGVGMTVWRHAPGDADGLPGNNVQAMLVDARDRIWVAVENGGVSVLDAQRRRFAHYRMATHPRLGSDDVWAIAETAGTVWLGTFGGGLHGIREDGRIVGYRAGQDGLPSDTVLGLAVDASGELWIGTDKGLARMHDGVVSRVSLPGADKPPLVYGLGAQGDALWVGTSIGVWRRDAGGRWSQPAWSSMFQRPNAMTGIACERPGDCWIASQRGLWRQRGNGVPEPVRTGGPPIARAIGSLLLQDDGALWVPVAGLGLGFLRSDWRHSARFSEVEGGLADSLYRAIAPARDGGFWLGGYDGAVERLDSAGNVAPLDADSVARLRGVKLSAIAEDAQGRLWLGHRLGLIRIGNDGVIDEWTPDEARDAAPGGQVDQLDIGPDGSVWLSAQGAGVQQRDAATGVVRLDIPANAGSGLGAGDTEALRVSPAGEVWIAGGMGAAVLDPAHGRFVVPPAMHGERAFVLAFDGADTLWLQRLTGLEQYRRGQGRWRRTATFGEDDGVPAVAANAMRVDERHRVWLSTPRGLFRWDPRQRHMQRLGVQDGATSQEFVDRVLALDRKGVLAASASDGGVLLVDTAAPEPPSAQPVLRFNGAAVRRDGEWRDKPMQDGLQLSRDDREFRVSARLLAYDDPASNRYWSRLDGFDSDWVALGASGDRVFTGLPPGTYTLRTRAQDAAGNVAQEISLAFDVPPPWWRTPWARAFLFMLVLLVIGTLAWLYRQRLKRRHAWQLAEHKRELAEQASEAKSRFLATLGHEVRTPMTGVLGMSELLLGTPLDARQRGHVDAIRRAGEHLLRLVNDALDLARIEAGKLELANADFALRPLLDEVAGLMAPVAERKGLAFVDALDAAAPAALHGDRTRIQQILLNLLGNAVKFTEQGHVSLETFGLQPQGLRFVVADSGPGLSVEQQARLFRRFEQADGARTAARYGGSGLGLAISQELAAAMGGRIAAESAPGSGTRFIVELPLPAVDLPVAPAAPRQPLDQPGAGALALLLVEDDPTIAEAIAGLLRGQGHDVTHAPHGLAALSELATRRFDMALLDLDLPGMDGLALAKLLRSQGFAAPLLAVTARADAEAEPQARAAGFDGFLRKPVTAAMLADAVAALAE